MLRLLPGGEVPEDNSTIRSTLGYLDRSRDLPWWRSPLGLLAVVVIGTAVLYPLPDDWEPALLYLVYLPGIVLVTIRYGFWWGLATAIVTVFAFDYFHQEPLFELSGKKLEKLTEVAVLGASVALISSLSERALRRALELRRQRNRLRDEEIRSEQLRRSDLVKTTVLRAVSHDFRTPLTALHASVQALGDPDLDPDVRREMVEMAAGATAELRKLVDDVLDLAQLERGGLGPQREWISLVDVISHALASEPEMDVELSVGELPLVRADPVQLGRALSNLLQNARRHAAGHGVRLSGTAGNGTAVRIVVSDRGPGVPDSLGEEAFEPFRSEGGAEGSGLGLAIARGFVEANGGRLRLERQEGPGANFVIELPIERPPPDRGERPPSDGDGERPEGR